MSNNNSYLSFPDAFNRAHLASCSDPRDKVYGILGLVDPEDVAEIHVDYAEPAEQLAFRITTHFIRNGWGVYALYNASGCNATGPSWTLPLHHRVKTDSLASLVPPLPNLTPENSPYNACRSTIPSFLWANSTQKLLTKGYILDSLSDLTAALVDSLNPGVAPDRLQWQLQAWEWVEKHKVNKPFIPPKIKGPLIRQLANSHYQALKATNEAFERACWTAAIADIVNPGGHRLDVLVLMRAFTRMFKRTSSTFGATLFHLQNRR